MLSVLLRFIMAQNALIPSLVTGWNLIAPASGVGGADLGGEVASNDLGAGGKILESPN